MAVVTILSSGGKVSIARSGVRLEARSADRAKLISAGAPNKKGLHREGLFLARMLREFCVILEPHKFHTTSPAPP